MKKFKVFTNEEFETISKTDVSDETLRIKLLDIFYDEKKYSKKELEQINIAISTFAECVNKKIFVPEKVIQMLSDVTGKSKEKIIKILNYEVLKQMDYKQSQLK